MTPSDEWIELDARRLHHWPLPAVALEADKEDRGRVLIVAGSREIPGAAVLAATAALRAGAGKVLIATAQTVATQMAFAVPEARVIGLPETASGALSPQGLELLRKPAQGADAALIGPGLVDEEGTTGFVLALLPLLTGAQVVLDALAMNAARPLRRFAQPALMTPHAGEMAHLSDCSKEDVVARDQELAAAAAHRFNCVVALKGATTVIAACDGGRWVHRGGRPGLATSGSGDVLSGLIAGLAARAVPLAQACAWGVVLHALAGARLAARSGPIGFLPRELPAEIPGLLKKQGLRAATA